MPKPKTKEQKAKLAEYMRQYRKKPDNLKRERKLERERYHQRHHDTTQQNVATVVIHPPRRVIPPPFHPPPPVPYVSKSLSLADRRDYEAKKKARQRLIKRHENMELFLKKQREERQRQREKN